MHMTTKSFLLFSIALAMLAPFSMAQTRILFIGNSYVASNDLPGVFDSLCQSAGQAVQTSSVAPGGFTFLQHTTHPATLQALQSQAWDFVILQEQSQRPSFSPGQVVTDVLPYAAILDSMVAASDSCARSVFYMTWGRKLGDAGNCPVYPPVCTYAGMQQRLRDSYLQMAQTHAAIVAPAGVAWQEAMLRDSTLELYISDQSHPNFAGTYLTACVMYASIFQQDPSLLSWNGSLSANTASFLRTVAKDVVLDSADQWQLDVYDVNALFNYTVQGDTVVFMDSSSNAVQYNWSFGDGDTSALNSPTHIYTAAGTYQVTLIASSPCGQDTFTRSLVIAADTLTSRIDVLPKNDFTLYPNPGVESITLKFDDDAIIMSIHITDASGKTYLQGNQNIVNNSLYIDTKTWPQGMYFIRVGNQHAIWCKDQ